MPGLPFPGAVCGVQGTNPKEGHRVHKSSAALLRLIYVVDQSPQAIACLDNWVALGWVEHLGFMDVAPREGMTSINQLTLGV
jgi:hypothetical protein